METVPKLLSSPLHFWVHPEQIIQNTTFPRNGFKETTGPEEGQSEATYEAPPLRSLHIRTRKLYAAGMIFSIMWSYTINKVNLIERKTEIWGNEKPNHIP